MSGSPNESSDLELVHRLVESDAFKELIKLPDPFDPFLTLGIKSNELVHSRLLKFFLDPKESHEWGNKFLTAFLRCIAERNTGRKFPNLSMLDGKDAVLRLERSHREHGRVDLIIEFPKERAVVAIENKIWHYEREKQVSDYQEMINKDYKAFNDRLVVFLTPTGYRPTTANDSSPVPWVAASYNDVLKSLDKVRTESSADTRTFVDNTIQHLHRNITMTSKLHSIVRKIWANPEKAKALHLINNYAPSLTKEVLNVYKAKFFELTNTKENQFNINVYPRKRGTPKELWLSNKSWVKKQIPIYITFFWYPTDTDISLPTVGAFVLQEKYKERKSKEATDNFLRNYPDIFTEKPLEFVRYDEWMEIFQSNNNTRIKSFGVGESLETLPILAAKHAYELYKELSPLLDALRE